MDAPNNLPPVQQKDEEGKTCFDHLDPTPESGSVDLLKFITCGSVDDGKSTLIGHLLFEANLLFVDQQHTLELESKSRSSSGEIDYSLLFDALIAEREQGITIDVAYRYFNTNKRSFIVADAPGHEQYTRNMAVGASFADLAVILVDASKGMLVQTKRHVRICSLMGIKHFVFAVNKMDLVNFDQTTFEEIEQAINQFMAEFDYESCQAIPVCATEGDNIITPSNRTMWYKGAPLLSYLEKVVILRNATEPGFTMPVQRVCRPANTTRGFQGQIESGQIAVGDTIAVLPGYEQANISDIHLLDQRVNKACTGDSVTLKLDTEIDISRGCVLVHDASPLVGTLFSATILWTDDTELIPGKNFLLKLATQQIPATVMKINYRIDANTGEKQHADSLAKNEIARCDIAVGATLVFDRFARNKALGSLILINRVTNMTSACGVVECELERSRNLTWHEMDITRAFREQQLNQRACTIWFSGLSASGKSTIANALERRLASAGKHTMLLDGDNIRLGLNKDLGFSEAERVENIRRIAEVSRLLNDAGLVVITAFISPFASDRLRAREIIGENFIEVYVSTPLEVCEQRDIKGLYQRARAGELNDFTGISSPYEVPSNPDVTVDASKLSVEQCVDAILEALKKIE